MKKLLLIAIIVAAAVYGYMRLTGNRPFSNVNSNIIMQITSSAFANNGTIPSIYTCDGQNINPPLSFSKIPADARSLALIMDDPDAPNGTFTHWVIYNMPVNTSGIAQNTKPQGTVATNGAGTKTYIGPCPPSGEHRYYFKLYALDIVIPDGSVANKNRLLEIMSGHTVDQAELLGRFKKSQ